MPSVINGHIPRYHHVGVHLFQLPLGDIESVRGRVKLICLEALVAQGDLERLVVLLYVAAYRQRLKFTYGSG